MDDCCCRVNDGTGGGDSKEDARCLSDAEYCDEGHKEDGRNVKKGNHGWVK